MSDRYARQEILPEVGAEGQARLGAASALFVGAGGLGCAAWCVREHAVEPVAKLLSGLSIVLPATSDNLFGQFLNPLAPKTHSPRFRTIERRVDDTGQPTEPLGRALEIAPALVFLNGGKLGDERDIVFVAGYIRDFQYAITEADGRGQ